jgi:nicotinamide-nucleotide amidase
MSVQHKAEVIAIGTELLMGEVLDTNSHYIASQLPMLGIELQRVTSVIDDREQIVALLKQALSRSSLVITTGGLGPTELDLTRECIAKVVGEVPEVDAGLEKQLREIFIGRGVEMPAPNLKQAWLIPSAKSIPNPLGTAPGWWVEKGKDIIIALPGPPRELVPMWQNEVKPRLQDKLKVTAIISRTIKTFSASESKVNEMVQPLFYLGNPVLGIYARPDGIHLRLIAQGENAQKLLDDASEKLREILGTRVWGEGDDTMAKVIGRSLTGRGLTLATMEDATGGIIANVITSEAGSAGYYRGGLVAGSDDMKIRMGVPEEVIKKYGAVSPESAMAMASAARERFSADFGLSTTGMAAKDNAAGRTPGISYIGVADSTGQQSWEQNYFRFRDPSGLREAMGAIFRLRERLIDLHLDDHLYDVNRQVR